MSQRRNNSYFDPWKKESKTEPKRLHQPRFLFDTVLGLASRIQKDDDNYPSLLDDDIKRYSASSTLQKAYKDYSKKYDHCMNVLLNPKRATRSTLIKCIVSYTVELHENGKDVEFDRVYNEAISYYLSNNADIPMDQMFNLYNESSAEEKINLIKEALNPLDKEEIVTFLNGTIRYMLNENVL